MIRHSNGRAPECVIVDLNTQHDFCDPEGALPVANLQALLPALRRVVRWGEANDLPVISSVESHRSTDVVYGGGDNGSCVDGSQGQVKIGFTLFQDCARIEVDNTLACPLNLFQKHRQVLFRKRTQDLLANPKADRLVNMLPPCEFILFGVGVEGAVKALALGLLVREKRVTVVTDACGYWNKSAADLAFRQMAAKGVQMTTVDEVVLRKVRRNWRYSVLPELGQVADNGTDGRDVDPDDRL